MNISIIQLAITVLTTWPRYLNSLTYLRVTLLTKNLETDKQPYYSAVLGWRPYTQSWYCNLSYQGDLQYYVVYQATVEVLSMMEPTVLGH